MYHFLLLASVLLSAEGLRFNSQIQASEDVNAGLSNSTYPQKTAHVYVINLKERKDRCQCVSAQLAGSPFPVFRIDAATPDTQFDLCPELQGLKKGYSTDDTGHHYNEGGQTALACSNHITWQRAANDKTDFTIVLEDDILLANNFWHKMQIFLDSDCQSHGWHRLVVDGFTFSRTEYAPKSYVCKHQNGEKNVMTDEWHYGTHVQIFKTSSLQKYLANNVVQIMDHSGWDCKDCTVGFWNPGISFQSSMGKRQLTEEKIPAFCSKTETVSDIQAIRFPTDARSEKLAFEC